ncbi:TniQ family protein [Rhizobium laguerreae]|uniref:TniQ family protein n=1 Tax=Rhizobium laguerreae TaxID=1076926 RepID=UPI0024848FB4|nr:TniQ family protein [Rhizobium laguerreae]
MTGLRLRYIVPTGSKRVQMGEVMVTRSYTQSKTTRLCTHCLAADDLAQPSAKPRDAYVRGSWSWRQIFACPVHGVPFIEGPRIEELGDLSYWAVTATVKGLPDPSDQYFHQRVLGTAKNSYLDAMEADVATELCSILGHMAATSDAKRMMERIPDGFENATCRREGFEIAVQGPRAVADFLRVRPAATDRRFGTHKSLYSPIIRWLNWNINDPNYRQLIDFFQDFAEQNLPLAPGERFIYPVGKRQVHSLKSAAAEYNISEARIERVVRENRGFTRGGKHFDRAAMHDHIVREQEKVTTSEAAKMMGCTAIRIDHLLKAGLLGYLPNDGIGERIFRFVTRTEVENFIDKLAAIIEPVASIDDLEVRRIAASNYKVTAAVRHILSGDIRACVLRGEPVRLDTIYLNIEDMQREKRADPSRRQGIRKSRPGSLSVDEIRVHLDVTGSTVEELFKVGLLLGDLRREDAKHHARRASKEEIDEFKKTYISAEEVAPKLGTVTNKLVKKLDRLGVEPVLRGFKNMAKIYRREDLEKHSLI